MCSLYVELFSLLFCWVARGSIQGPKPTFWHMGWVLNTHTYDALLHKYTPTLGHRVGILII